MAIGLPRALCALVGWVGRENRKAERWKQCHPERYRVYEAALDRHFEKLPTLRNSARGHLHRQLVTRLRLLRESSDNYPHWAHHLPGSHERKCSGAWAVPNIVEVLKYPEPRCRTKGMIRLDSLALDLDSNLLIGTG